MISDGGTVVIIKRGTRSGSMERKSPLTDQRRNLMTEDMDLSWWSRTAAEDWGSSLFVEVTGDVERDLSSDK
jgi:hypothetical protein